MEILVVKMGVLRQPTPSPALRSLLILSKEKNRTLGTLAKTLLLKNIKTQLIIHTWALWQCLFLEPWDVERLEQSCYITF
jgi:hypothetical protein